MKSDLTIPYLFFSHFPHFSQSLSLTPAPPWPPHAVVPASPPHPSSSSLTGPRPESLPETSLPRTSGLRSRSPAPSPGYRPLCCSARAPGHRHPPRPRLPRSPPRPRRSIEHEEKKQKAAEDVHVENEEKWRTREKREPRRELEHSSMMEENNKRMKTALTVATYTSLSLRREKGRGMRKKKQRTHA